VPHARKCYEHDVRPSDMLVDCDHILQQKVETGTHHAESADVIRNSILRTTSEAWNMLSFALWRHPAARISRYIIICCSS